MPAALSFPIGNRRYDWGYESEPEPFMNGRRIYHARGKLLGGSSSINGMIFQRGNPMDFERWAGRPGLENWDYAHCLPYFKRMETCVAGADEWRGGEGPLVVERGPASSPLFRAFFEAVQQAGYELTSDVNGERQEGFAPFDRNIHRGRRLSAARAYLHPVLRRPNLDVRCRALVTRVVFEGTRAVGVEVVHRGKTEVIRAGEVILCGGAINSPQLLQLSGVGNADELRGVGVDVVHDLAGVGENLQDHLEVYVQHASTRPVSVAPAMKWRNRPWVGFRWLVFRSGPGATNHFEGGGFVRSNDEVTHPNLMFHFLPLAIRYDGTQPAGGHGYQVHVGPMFSDALGSVKITSTDPRSKPALRFNYLSTEQDRTRVARGDSLRAVHPGAARLRALRRRRGLARARSRDGRGDPRLGRAGRRDGSPPVLLVPHGSRRAVGRRPGDDARPRARGPAGRGRVGHAVDHERESLRADDDAGREGGRSRARASTPLEPSLATWYRHEPTHSAARA